MAAEEIAQSDTVSEEKKAELITSFLRLLTLSKRQAATTADEASREAILDALKDASRKLGSHNDIAKIMPEADEDAHRSIPLDECCDVLQADIFASQTSVLNAIDNLCAATPLTQANVVANTLELTESGNYIFCEDITATLVIAGSGIEVDLNNRTLFGIVSILGDPIIQNGFIQAPAPLTSDVEAAISILNPVTTRLANLTIICSDSTAVGTDNNGLDGRGGIYNKVGAQTFITDCFIQAGAGATGGNSVGPSTLAGNGGNGGFGISSLENNIQITRVTIKTGAGGDGGNTMLGGTLKTAGYGGDSGIGIEISFGDYYCDTCDINIISDSTICTGNGGAGGYSCCADSGIGGNSGGNSGDGIVNSCKNTEIKDSTIRTGNGGPGGNSATDIGGSGGNSGNAITTQGTQIVNVILSTGDAGDGADGTDGGAGGSAGHGVFVNDACECQIRGIVVESTGNGGIGGSSIQTMMPGNGGNGGNGGDAVHITQGSRHAEVRSSTLSRTGNGGLGGSHATSGGTAGTAGNPGRAVTDMNNDPCSLDPLCTTTYYGASAIFENLAYAIADTNIRYLINGQAQESGKASDRSCNRLDNVYVECNVNVTYDICEEIYTTQTVLSAQIAECCACDYFITQNANGEFNNQPIASPITQPGIYCIAEDLIGTLSIEASHVTIIFNGHTLIGDAGIVSIGNDNIVIQGGTITNSNPAVDIENGINVQVNNMIFSGNAVGINLNNVQDFSINDNIFTNYTDTSINLTSCTNGKIASCQIHTNNSTNTAPLLTLVSTSSCSQLLFDTIVMTENINTTTFVGLNAVGTDESTFNTILITSNQVTDYFTGIQLQDCANNTISGCTVNENSLFTVLDFGTFIGFDLNATMSGGCQSNNLDKCQCNSNTFNAESGVFVGINIGTAMYESITPDNACINCSVTNCSINNNVITTNNDVNCFIGVGFGNVIDNGTLGNNVCANSRVNNVSVSNNTSNNTPGEAELNCFLGISFGSIITAGGGTTSLIGNNVCTSCSVTDAYINNNSFTNSGVQYNSFAGISFGSINHGFDGSTNTIGNNVCTSCSINNCSINNNSCLNNAVGFNFFVGISLGNLVVQEAGTTDTLNSGVCASCSINNVSVNNNSYANSDTEDVELNIFTGIMLGSIIDIFTGSLDLINDGVCSGCSISNSTINGNSSNHLNTANDLDFYTGISLCSIISGIATDSVNSVAGGCQNCIVTNCAINNNSCSVMLAYFYGINLSGVTLSNGLQQGNGCNNCIFDGISILNNNLTVSDSLPDGTFPSFIYGISMNAGAPTSLANGCNNIIYNQCIIENNSVGVIGNFIGFFVNGVGSGSPHFTNGGCNNLSFNECQVNNNTATGGFTPFISDAYQIIGTGNGRPNGAQNMQFTNCSAKKNTSTSTALNGFDAFNMGSAQWINCSSIANTTAGFLLTNVSNSSLDNCKALTNGGNGFDCEGTTNNVTIINNQALGNASYGFDFASTTTQCLIRNDIAQNNGAIGFNNVDGDTAKHQFYGNFAQANTGGNYFGVALVTNPDLTTSSFANVVSY